MVDLFELTLVLVVLGVALMILAAVVKEMANLMQVGRLLFIVGVVLLVILIVLEAVG